LSAHYFVADAHLSASTEEPRRRLLDFLASIQSRADSLFVLGDLFDFGFEYRRGLPAGSAVVLDALRRVRDAGTRVLYLPGNHDFRLGPRVRASVEVATGRSVEMELDGRRVWLAHGDELDPRPVSALFRALGRNHAAVALYSLLGQRAGTRLAGWVSGRSRARPPDEPLRDRMAAFAQQRLLRGDDVVVLAHSHLPELRQLERGTYLNVGDWLGGRTFGVMRDGVVSLERFP